MTTLNRFDDVFRILDFRAAKAYPAKTSDDGVTRQTQADAIIGLGLSGASFRAKIRKETYTANGQTYIAVVCKFPQSDTMKDLFLTDTDEAQNDLLAYGDTVVAEWKRWKRGQRPSPVATAPLATRRALTDDELVELGMI